MPWSSEENFFKKYSNSSLFTPKLPPLWVGVHEIYNFGRPFLGHHYYILGLSDQCLGVEKKFLRNTAILHFLPQNYLPFGWGFIKFYNFFSPYPTDASYQIGPVVLEKKMLTRKARRRMPTYSNRSP